MEEINCTSQSGNNYVYKHKSFHFLVDEIPEIAERSEDKANGGSGCEPRQRQVHGGRYRLHSRIVEVQVQNLSYSMG